jgi:membrane protein YdbS with pleckstrin-like domain
MANKVDKGFELMYWRLSYRRKFIRTLWVTPFLLGTIILIFVSPLNIVYAVAISIILLVIFLIQLIYNYKKWKRTEK